MISTVDNGVQRSFNKVKLQARESVIATAAKAKNASEQSSTRLVETVEEAIQAAFDGIDQTVRSMFGVLVLLEAVSNVVLLGGLVGALAMILGRVLFDARAKDLKKLHAFSLSKGSASKLDFCVLDEVRLNDKALAGSDKGWHIFTLASRHGEGTHLILAVPQPTSSLFQRIFTNRLLMTCVDTNAEQVRDADKGHAPTISSPGDLQFVCIGVRPGQAITFKMGDLSGFTANVHLRSVYTTHVGANLLGLGTFYSVAYVGSEDAAMGSDTSGEPGSAIGTIILRSDGNRIGCADAQSNSWRPEDCLRGTAGTKFAVKQELGLVGVWLVPGPDVQVQDEAAGRVRRGNRGESADTSQFVANAALPILTFLGCPRRGSSVTIAPVHEARSQRLGYMQTLSSLLRCETLEDCRRIQRGYLPLRKTPENGPCCLRSLSPW